MGGFKPRAHSDLFQTPVLRGPQELYYVQGYGEGTAPHLWEVTPCHLSKVKLENVGFYFEFRG